MAAALHPAARHPPAVVKTIVVDALRRDLMAADEVEAFMEGYQRVINQGRSMESAERQQVERELATLDRKLDGLYDAIAEGLRSPGLKEKLDSWEALRTTVPTLRNIALSSSVRVPMEASTISPELSDW